MQTTHIPHAWVPASIARNAALSPQARCLFTILATYARPDGTCWPLRKTLAADLGSSVRTIATLLNELERAGFLRRQTRFAKSTIFHLRSSKEQPITEEEAELTDSSDAVQAASPVSSEGGSPLPSGGQSASFTGETDCLPTSGQGEAHFLQEGSLLPSRGKPASYRTLPLNIPTELLPETEAEPPPTEPPPVSAAEPTGDPPPEADPWSTRREYDPASRWPTLEQAYAYARRSGVPEAATRSIWESYTAVGWVDRHGSPIRHWGAALTSAWRYREENRSRAQQRGNPHYAFTPSTHRSHEHQRNQQREAGTRSPQPATGTNRWANDPRYLETVALLEARGYQFNA